MEALEFKNGDILPSMGLGTWLSGKSEVYDAVLEAIRVGYRHIDCAYIYQNEAEIGHALHVAMKTGLVKREELFITSKLWNSDHSPERVEAAIRKSLADLQLDYLDLYLVHWPVVFRTGHDVVHGVSDLVPLDELPLEVTWKAMEKVHGAGLARHIGVSNFSVAKLEKMLENVAVAPEVLQVELHPYLQQHELLGFCCSKQILVTAYSPLGSRHLVKSESGLANEPAVRHVAGKHGCTPAQVLLAWGMKRGTAVIPKSVNPARIRENFNSVNVELDKVDMAEIAALERNQRMARAGFCVMPGGPYTFENVWDEPV
ncbi:MAG TPA: aldo/keto reductase [Paludibacter sp.]|nr:aldo/keto reductase [Paludibacter sp.]